MRESILLKPRDGNAERREQRYEEKGMLIQKGTTRGERKEREHWIYHGEG